MRLFIGIDWAQEWNDVCALAQDGKEVCRFRFEQSAADYAKGWERILGAAGDPKEVFVGIERPHGPLVEFLLRQGAVLYPLNPKAVDRARDRHRASSSKDDGFDAFVIADFVRTDQARLHALEPDSPLARELKALSRDREEFVAERTRLVNKLEAALRLYFVAALDLFTDLHSDVALAFITDYATPQAAATLRKGDLRRWLKKHRYTRLDRLDDIYATLQRPPPPADEVSVRVESRLAVILAEQLQVVVRRIREYDRAIETLFSNHKDHDLFTSLPGAGEVLAPKLAAELGGESTLRVAVNVVRCRAGTAPVTISTGKRSGKKAIVLFRRACCKPMRQALQQFAVASVSQCAWAGSYFRWLVSHGKHKAEAYRMLADKWLPIILAMRRQRTPYDDQRYSAILAQRAPWYRESLNACSELT